MKVFILLLSFTIAATGLFAQSSEVLNNKSIIELTEAGMSKKIILSKIESSSCKFTTDTKSLIALKKSKVDEDVIDAMVEKMAGSDSDKASVASGKSSTAGKADKEETTTETAKTSAGTSPAASKVIPQLKKEGSGIYYYNAADNTIQPLDPTVFSQQKNNNNWANSFTYGFGKSTKVMSVSGNEANVQFKEKTPVFYFYFDPENKSLNSQAPTWFATVTSPNEFLLIKFETKIKNVRAVTTASANSYESAQGIDEKYRRSFKSKRLEKGIYEVYFESEGLENGEYGFMYAGATAVNGGASPKVYDFGVH